MAGVDTEAFKTHSTGSASSSKTKVTVFSLTNLIKQRHWSQASTFQIFYKIVSKNMILIFNQESSTSSFEERRLE